MNKFSGKYEMIAEVALNRYQQGGFLIGDYVKIKKNALNNEKIKGMSDQYKERIKQFKDSDVNLRICAVKTTYPNTSFGVVGSPDAPTGEYVDVVQEISHSNWVNPTTIPMDAVELVETEFYAPIPDSVKRASPEPTKFDKDGVAKGDMGADEYMRMSKNLNLTDKNTKLANSNKWDDNKPGAGNMKGVDKPKKLNDSVNVNDEKMLAEKYISIFEAGAPVATAAVPAPVSTTTATAPVKQPVTLDTVAARLKMSPDQLKASQPDQLSAAIKQAFPQETDDTKIQAAVGKIQQMIKQTPAAPAATPTTEAPAATEAPKQGEADGVNPLENEPAINEPGGYIERQGYQEHEPQTAQGVMNPQERRPDDQRFAALMDLRKQQMANDQANTQARIAQQGERDAMTNSRFNRSNDRAMGYPQNIYGGQDQVELQAPQRGYIDPMRSSPSTQSQDWEGGSQGFGGQLGNILQNTGLNTAENAGTGLSSSIGGAVDNVVGNIGQGLGNRAYDWAGGSKNPDRNDSRYNSGNQNSSGQQRGGARRSRYQTGY